MLVDDNLHGRQVAGYAVRALCTDARDVEAFATLQSAETVLLALGESTACRHLGNGITHRVEDYSLKADHAKFNVQQTIVNSGMKSGSTKQSALREWAAAFVACSIALGITISDIGCWVGQFTNMESGLAHGAAGTFVGAGDGEGDGTT